MDALSAREKAVRKAFPYSLGNDHVQLHAYHGSTMHFLRAVREEETNAFY